MAVRGPRGTWHRALRGDVVPEARDLLLLGYLPAVALASCIVPEAAWMPMCARVARVSAHAGRARGEKTRRIDALLSGRMPAGAAVRLAVEIGAHHHYARLQLFRCYRSPSWRPRIALIGREHAEAALAAGRGGVFWNAPFVHNNLVAKMALHQAGFAVTHLSGIRHGLSTSGFAQRYLNPIWARVEDRFLAERVLLTTALSPGALRELMRRVRDNQLISITMGPEGRRRYTAEFFGGFVTLANGAPALAQRTGAALLPVFTVRAADGSFVTTIEAPAHIPAGVEAEEAVRQLVFHARLLESYVWRWPGQFDGWTMAQPDQRARPAAAAS